MAAASDGLSGAGDTRCMDCGAALAGKHCHRCGQHEGAPRSLRHAAHEALHGVLHLDGKVWRTLPLLAFRPGRLVREYVYGRRTRYVGPFATFLVAVLALVVMLGFAPDGPQTRTARSPAAAALASGIDQVGAAADAVADRVVRAVATPEQLRRLELDQGYSAYKLRSLGSKLSVLIVPIALPVLWLLFCWRREIRLYDHVVFLLYEMSVLAFLLGAARLWRTTFVEPLILLLLVLPLLHVLVALKDAYVLSWPGALARTALFFVGILAAFWVFVVGVAVIVVSG